MPSKLPTRRTRSNANLVLGLMALALTLAGATQVDAWLERGRAHDSLRAKQSLVAELGLTDLCLFTEARYTRNPTQADLNTAFQDHPLSLDHFPSGSLIQPPQGMGGVR